MIDSHEEIEMLIPWYVNGTLDLDQVTYVKQHLNNCADCRELVAEELLLKDAVAGLPFTSANLTMLPISYFRRPSPIKRGWQATNRTFSRWRRQPVRIVGFAAAQAAMLAAVFVLAQPATRPDAEFRMLSAGEPTRHANAIIIFKSETTEEGFRRLLVSAEATIVGGPTDSHSYLIAITPKKRDSGLDWLRKQPQVSLVQPLDRD